MAKQPQKYHDLITQLDDVMEKLQQDDIDVDAAVAQYERGLKLTRQLTDYLTTAENKITELGKLSD